VGDAVAVGDSIRTNSDQGADIAFDFGHMKLKEGGDITLKILDAHLVRAQVSGRAEIEVADGGELALESAGSDAVATSRGGHLSVFADGRGGTAIAAIDGSATLAGSGRTLELRAGEFSTARTAGLSRPVKIPSRITLKVTWPPDADPTRETNKSVITVQGHVSAFSEVTVQGKPVKNQSADGAFSVDVPLRKGKQRVIVAAKDVLGRRAADARTVTMDPDAPDIKGHVEYR
jgi:hypothetical protein